MKKNWIIITAIAMIAFSSCKEQKHGGRRDAELNKIDSTDQTNNFYDNADSQTLPIKDITIEGEVAKTGKVDFSKLQKHTVIVKEAKIEGDSNKFIGSYRYDGYSLFDILNEYIPKKLNQKEFNPIIDLYVEIENDKGEKVVISRGEIYYPSHLNEIIIATNVRRIVPSKTKELWPLPTDSKLVVSSDLLTERNISNPVKISVKSYPRSIKATKDMKPCFSPKMEILVNDSLVKTMDQNPKDLTEQTYNTIFYGRGKGIHSTTPFKGVLLKEVLIPFTSFNKEMLKTGLIVIVGVDGYRCVYTFSEMMNRNDQAEILLVCNKKATDKGIFKAFPACDFFSDRAVKAISKIYIEQAK
jgi:hypothetical protein